MDDVIENCQTTFEEDGVNPQILDDLRKVGSSFTQSSKDQAIIFFCEFHRHQAPGHHRLIRRCTGSRCLWCYLFLSVVEWPSADIATFGHFWGAQAGREILGDAEHLTHF